MSVAMESAETIILLDESRRKVDQAVRNADSAVALLLRRLNNAWSSIPDNRFPDFREQVLKALSLAAELRDFRDYLNEPRAWAPAKEDR